MLGLIAPPSGVQAAELLVFAAASLTESLQEIAGAYEQKSGDHVVFNLGGSGLLARQIEQGGPADLFFSADESRMDALEKGGWLLPGTRTNLLSNTLVIVVATDRGAAVTAPADLASTKVRRLALAETRSVPAGIYARQFLERQNLWNAVESRVVPTENVRTVYEIPVQDLSPIRYPVAVIRASRQPEAARRFLLHLLGAESTDVFRRRGFIILP